jgi:hypothetical protein
MPTERRACREADSAVSDCGVEAPWIEPVSRSASKPDSASLHLERSANLSKMPKPTIRREGTFTSSGGDLRGDWGQRAGKVGIGQAGRPLPPLRGNPEEARAESIRRELEAGESERPIVASKRGNARGAKGPWQDGADSKRTGTAWSGENRSHYRRHADGAFPWDSIVVVEPPVLASEAACERQTTPL